MKHSKRTIMYRHTLPLKSILFTLCLLCFAGTTIAQPGGNPGGRPGRPMGGDRPNRTGGDPSRMATQSLRQKKVVNDSTLLLLTGMLQDSLTSEGIPYVTVSILNGTDSTLLRGTITADNGTFEVKNMHKGNYILQVSCIGYETKHLPFEMTNNTALGTIRMKPGNVTLGGVEITAARPMFAMEGEKMIYNVAEDPSVQDGTTSDALQNAPGVEVDIEGNVTLRGVSSVEIWINDRPSKLTKENLKTYIETLPANALDHIEIISNPSAEYATESDAVINIITSAHIKKNHFISFGLNGTSTPSFRPWISYLWANEKLSVNLYASLSRQLYETESHSYSASSPWNSDSNAYILAERDTNNGTSSNTNYHGNAFLSFSYTIDSTRDLFGWGNFNINAYKQDIFKDHIRDQTFSGDHLYHYIDTDTSSGAITYGMLGINYTKKFDKRGHNLRLTLRSNLNTNTDKEYWHRNYTTIYTFADENTYEHHRTYTTGLGLSARYNRPLTKDLTLSVGAGIDYDNNQGTYTRTYYDTTTHDYNTQDPLRSYDYHNQSNKADADVNLTQKLGAFTIKVGLGTDISHTHINYQNAYYPDDTTLQYTTWRPSLHLSYYTKNMHNFNLSYTLRSSNPSARQLTTFRTYSEDSYSTGNRDLKTQLRHQMEAGWSKYITGFGFVGVDAYYNYASNTISNLTDVTPEADEHLLRIINYSMPYNIGYSYRYGIDMHGTYRPTGTFNLRLNANLYNYGYHMDRGAQGILDDHQWSYSVRLNGWYKILNNYQLYGSANYRSATIGLASISKATYDLDFGVRGDFLKRKISAFIMINDIFNWGYRYGRGNEDTNPAYTRNSTSKDKTSRFITAGITFRFGKMELETRARQGDETTN